MKLLIIEDEWLVASFIADVAIEQSIEVVGIAQSYDEMKAIVDKHPIDLAIVDINIKGSSHGIDVAKYLKSKNIQFLFLTAYKDYDIIQDATDLKPLNYLTKPVTQESLTASLLIAKKTVAKIDIPQHQFTINKDKTISYQGKQLLLSEHEFKVLVLLIKNFQNIVPHETFYEYLYNLEDEFSNGTLRNTILKLRKNHNLNIKSVRNIGYVLN